MTTLRSIVFGLILIYLVVAMLLVIFQRQFLYFPTPDVSHNFPVMSLESGDETINVITLNPQRAKAILYFGGNAETVLYNAQDFADWLPDHTIYLLNYRGYGGSTGSPTEQGLYADALALYDKIHQSHDTVSVIGRSLGSGVATLLATQRPLTSVVLITPYDSIRQVAQDLLPIYPMSLLLKDQYDSLSRTGQINARVLIITAENDRVIPAKHSDALFKAFADQQAQLTVIDGADHNNLSSAPEYRKSLIDFIVAH